MARLQRWRYVDASRLPLLREVELAHADGRLLALEIHSTIVPAAVGRGITVAGRLLAVGGVRDVPLPLWPEAGRLEALAAQPLPVWSKELIPEMEREICAARAAGDSVGGVRQGLSNGGQDMRGAGVSVRS